MQICRYADTWHQKSCDTRIAGDNNNKDNNDNTDNNNKNVYNGNINFC